MRFNSVIQALRARRVGTAWMALCPAHKDRNPSLAIREVDGKVLLHCHAGCNQLDIIAALKQRGIWESGTSMDSSKPRKTIAATYQYTDQHGNVLYEIIRWDTTPKTFSQRYPDGHRGWIWKKHPHQVLYHLPEVLEAPIVFVVEGEKDVETLRAHGFVATTNAGGAKASWLPEFTEALRGREVIIIPDNDQPGWNRAVTIGRALFGKVARLMILELESGKDITDWFERGHSEIELIAQLGSEAVCR
jgi:putative DNA primase/helicase